MLKSFSEFKFFQSIRVPVEEADEILFLVEMEKDSEMEYVKDAKLVDVSINGVGFISQKRMSVGQNLRISVHYKRVHLDLECQIVRTFTGNVVQDGVLLYGAEYEEGEKEDVKRFLEQYILSFSPERLRDCMVQMTLTERYAAATEGLEMLSLMLSIFKDIVEFGEKSDFIENMLEEITRVLNAQRSVIYLINPDSNQLEAISSIGIDRELLKFDYRKGLPGQVFTSGVPLNIDTLTDSSRFSPEMDKALGQDTKSVICNPITNREEKVVGILEVVNKRDNERFNTDDEKVMKVISLIFSGLFHNYNPISSQSSVRRFSTPFDRKNVIIGKSSMINNLRNALVRLKDLDTPFIVQGEFGVGKTLFAKVIHHEGKRGSNNYFEIDCAGNDIALLEEQLFGSKGKQGKVEFCRGGTLVIRNIHLLSLHLQMKLAQSIGENQDTRIVVTTIRNLERMLAEGRMNSDLFQSISQGLVYISPLRKREKDIKDLIVYFTKLECRKQGFLLKELAPTVLKQFMEYDWPGNISELKTAVERLVLYNPRSHVISSLKNQSTPILNSMKTGIKMFEDIPYASDSNVVLKDRLALVERQMILVEVKRNNGNKSKAARDMGISREALRKKLMMSQEILDALEGYKSQAGFKKTAA